MVLETLRGQAEFLPSTKLRFCAQHLQWYKMVILSGQIFDLPKVWSIHETFCFLWDKPGCCGACNATIGICHAFHHTLRSLLDKLSQVEGSPRTRAWIISVNIIHCSFLGKVSKIHGLFRCTPEHHWRAESNTFHLKSSESALNIQIWWREPGIQHSPGWKQWSLCIHATQRVTCPDQFSNSLTKGRLQSVHELLALHK